MSVLAASGNTVGLLIKADADTGAISATTVKLEEMGRAAEASSLKSASSFESFGNSLGKIGHQSEAVGRSMSTYVTAPIVGIGYESVKSAIKFQQSMEMLHTNAGTAQNQIAGLSDAILKLAPQVGAGPDALAQAFYHIASAGNGLWSTSKQLDILKISAEGAAVGQAKLDDTTYSLTSTMASGIKGAESASAAMGTLTAIVGAGDMHFQDLNAAIGTGFLGTAASFGISLSSVGAALATLTDNGEHADAAATRLRMTWALMASPSHQATKQLEALGLTADGAAKASDQMNAVFAKSGLTTTKLATDLQQPNGMNVALKDLQSHLKVAGLNAAETDAMLAKAFGGGRTDAALLTMLQNLDRTDVKFKDIAKSGGDFSEKWGEQQQLANQKFKESWAGIQASMIKLGDEIMPVVTKDFQQLAFWIQDVSKWFNGLSQGQKTFVLHAVETVAVLGPMLFMFGKLATSISSIAKLSSTVGKGLGLFGEAEKIGATASKFGALGTAAEVAGPEVAGLGAALGPVALGIAAVAAVGVGGVLIVRHLQEEHVKAAAAARKSADEHANNAKQLLTDGGAHKTATKLINDHTEAMRLSVRQDQAASFAKLELNVAQTTYNKTAVATSEALKKYGPESSQYLKALEEQASAQKQLSQATDAWNRVADAAKNAHSKINDAAKNLNGTYYTASQNAAKYNLDTQGLTRAKNVEQDAHQRTKNAATDYVATIKMFGPHSDVATQAADRLSRAKDAEAKATGSVSWWSRQVAGDLSRERDEANRLSGAIDNLSAKSSRLSNVKVPSGLHYATGTNYARGGWATVGEHGPEQMYVPQGAQIKSAAQSAAGGGGGDTNNNSTVTIGTVVLASQGAVGEFFRKIDQDTLLSRRGLTPNRGGM